MQEHFTALREARFDGEVHVGLVGGLRERQDVRRWLSLRYPEYELEAEADEGFEMVTLNVMHQWAKAADPRTAVLYCHSKGAFQATRGNCLWRRAMTARLVSEWQERVNDLHSHDAVGMHWLTNAENPDKIFQPGIFGGNFWWATAGYIASLPPLDPQGTSRYAAEGWVGLNDPDVKALSSCWPDYF